MLTEKQLLATTPALHKYASQLNRAERDDLVQSALLRAWEKRHLFEGDNATPWVMHILHNQYINGQRRDARHNGTPLTEVQHTPESQSGHVFYLEVRDAIRTLPENQQQLLVYAAMHGEKYDDAARSFDIPIGTVRSRLWRGREKLRQQFA